MQKLNHSLVVFVLFLMTGNICFAQCPSSDITITNQNQIDHFQQTYPNCHRLSGSLFIEATNVTNLDSLSQIDTIDLKFSIVDNLQLTSLQGLKNLKSVQDFTISGSPLITNFKGMDSLKIASNSFVIGQMNGLETLEGIQPEYVRQFIIIQCDKLMNLQGLDKLERVSTFSIIQNENLISLNGVNPQLTFGDHFRIDLNPKLVELANFENFDFVYNLNITNNPVLKNLNGLKNLERTYYFGIVNNPALENLDVLTNMKTIEIAMVIEKNASLKSIEGLSNLDATLLDTMAIVDNTSLSMCNMKSICDFLNLNIGGYSISNNATSCSDKPSILSQCMTTQSLSEKSNDISYYPNPSSDFVYFKGLRGISTMNLYHISGRYIQRVEVSGDELILPVTNLAEGIYFLKPSYAQGIPFKTIKLLVSHSK